MIMLCDGCIYRGRNFEHLSGHSEIETWLSCTYPTPYWVTPQAMPDVPLKNNICKTRKLK